MGEERFSEVLRQANKTFSELDSAAMASARAAFRECFRPTGQFRTLEGGRKVQSFTVDLDPLRDVLKEAGAKAALEDLKLVEREMAKEGRFRGENFVNESMHLALKEYLTAFTPPATDAPAVVDAPEAKARPRKRAKG